MHQDLEAILRRAGEIAKARQYTAVAERKPDRTWVTDADVEVEQFLVEQLTSLVPGSAFLGEEGGLRSADNDLVWAVDPIDGTADYMRGLPGWSISAGLFEREEPSLGAVYMPVTGDYYSHDSGVATWQGASLAPPFRPAIDDNSLLLVPFGAARRYRISHAGPIQCVGSSSAHLLYVARGAATAAVADPLYIWDLAVAVPFLRATNCDVCYISGAQVDLVRLLERRITPEPVIAAPTGLLEAARLMIVETTA